MENSPPMIEDEQRDLYNQVYFQGAGPPFGGGWSRTFEVAKHHLLLPST